MTMTAEWIAEICDNPLYKTLGIMVESAEEGRALLRLTPAPDVCWPHIGPHGGILFTALDTTSAWAVMSLLEPGQDCSTIDMNIHYVQQARGDFFICRAEVTHRAGRTCFVRSEMRDPDDNLVCLAQGVFRVLRGLKKSIWDETEPAARSN